MEQGHEVSVVTSDHPEWTGRIRLRVRVYRVNQLPSPLGFLDSVLYMNYHPLRAVQIILQKRL